jgi:hypothetical protein
MGKLQHIYLIFTTEEITIHNKVTVFWDVTPCNLVERQECFGGASTYLQNFGAKLPNYIVSHPTELYVMLILLRGPKISYSKHSDVDYETM